MIYIIFVILAFGFLIYSNPSGRSKHLDFLYPKEFKMAQQVFRELIIHRLRLLDEQQIREIEDFVITKKFEQNRNYYTDTKIRHKVYFATLNFLVSRITYIFEKNEEGIYYLTDKGKNIIKSIESLLTDPESLSGLTHDDEEEVCNKLLEVIPGFVDNSNFAKLLLDQADFYFDESYKKPKKEKPFALMDESHMIKDGYFIFELAKKLYVGHLFKRSSFFAKYFDAATNEPDIKCLHEYLDTKVHWPDKMMEDESIDINDSFKIVIHYWTQMVLSVYEGLKSGLCDALTNNLLLLPRKPSVTSKTIIDKKFLGYLKRRLEGYDIINFGIPEILCPLTKPSMRNIMELINKGEEIPASLELAAKSDDHHTCPEAIDLNEFLKKFHCLHLDDGYILDYVYTKRPLVYCRKQNDQPIITEDEFFARFNFDTDVFIRDPENYEDVKAYPEFKYQSAFIEHLHTENSPEGLFELALFLHSIKSFYLFDHYLYEKVKYIYTKSAFDLFLYQAANDYLFRPVKRSYSIESVKSIKHLDFAAHLTTFDDGTKEIYIMTENPWNGLRWLITTFDQNNVAVKTRYETVIESECHTLL